MEEKVGLYGAVKRMRSEDCDKTLSAWRVVVLTVLAENIEDIEHVRNITNSHPDRKEKQEETLRAHARMLYYAIAIRDMIRIATRLHAEGQTEKAKIKNVDSIESNFLHLEECLNEWWGLWRWIKQHWHDEIAKNSERALDGRY